LLIEEIKSIFLNEGQEMQTKTPYIFTPWNRGGSWPTYDQRLLLKACLLEGEPALKAWHEWKASIDFDSLETGSRRMLPLLFQNLKKHHVSDPLMEKMKGIYRYTWSKNQLLVRNFIPALETFTQAGIKTIILKGWALILHYYKDYGLRPMNDIDCLVRKQDAYKAFHVMQTLDWYSRIIQIEKFHDLDNTPLKALHFNNSSGGEIDLHWRSLYMNINSQLDHYFWEGAVPVQIENNAVYLLNPADQLIHTCAHGIIWNRLAPFRWIADAAVILRNSNPGINWDDFISKILKLRLILELKYSLTYLKMLLDIPIPLYVTDTLNDCYLSKREKREFYIHTHKVRKMLGSLFIRWRIYRHQSQENQSKLRHFLGFIPFLKTGWQIKSWWVFPVILLLKIVERVLSIVGIVKK